MGVSDERSREARLSPPHCLESLVSFRENREEAAMRYPKAPKEDLTAPQTQYRVLGVEINATSESVFSVGDFDSLDAAKNAAEQKAGPGVPIFIYNDHGELIVRYGSWH